MAIKTHFKATKEGSAACAVGRPSVSGVVRKNNRATYTEIPESNIVGPDSFRNTPTVMRCSHCAAQFTDRINIRRTRTGKPLYRDAFTKELL